MSKMDKLHTPVAPIDYVTRIMEGLHPSERAQFDKYLSQASLRHGLRADIDRDHPIIGVLAEFALFGVAMTNIHKATADVASRCEESTRKNEDLLSALTAHVMDFPRRVRIAEQNAIEKIHAPANRVYESHMNNLAAYQKELCASFGKLRKVLLVQHTEDMEMLKGEYQRKFAELRHWEKAAHEAEYRARLATTRPVLTIICTLVIGLLVGLLIG